MIHQFLLGIIMPKDKDIVLMIDCNDLLWVKKECLPEINIRNVASPWIQIKSNSANPAEVVLTVAWINEDKMKELIEYACLFFGGLGLVTDEAWGEQNHKKAIADCLELQKRAALKIRSAPFLSTRTVA